MFSRNYWRLGKWSRFDGPAARKGSCVPDFQTVGKEHHLHTGIPGPCAVVEAHDILTGVAAAVHCHQHLPGLVFPQLEAVDLRSGHRNAPAPGHILVGLRAKLPIIPIAAYSNFKYYIGGKYPSEIDSGNMTVELGVGLAI